MWYHGQHGEKDYDKAFFYFTKGAEGDGKSGSLWCKCKLADMYRYGCSVEKDEGKYRKMIEEAYEEVKHPQFLGDPFWGHIEVMGRIVRLLYQITPYEADRSDFYDLFYLTERPGKYTMKRKGKKTRIIVTEEGGERAIGCGGKWYRSFEEFCWKAETGNERYTYIYDEFYGLEVER